MVGIANSTLDLAMNANGVSIERGMDRPILSSLHAAFAFGVFFQGAIETPAKHLAHHRVIIPAGARWLR